MASNHMKSSKTLFKKLYGIIYKLVSHNNDRVLWFPPVWSRTTKITLDGVQSTDSNNLGRCPINRLKSKRQMKIKMSHGNKTIHTSIDKSLLYEYKRTE